MTCNDNATEYCGAGNRLNVYQKNGTYIPSTSSSGVSSTSLSAGSTTAPVSAPTSTSGPQIKQVVSNNWAFQGCYTEGTNARALANITYASDSMTLESCAAFCVGNSMFGVEYSRECYCANSLSTGSVLATTQADCSMTCKGDGTEYCGAGNRLQLYAFNAAASASNSSTSSSLPTSTSPSSSASRPTSSSSSLFSSLSGSSSSSSTSTSLPISSSSSAISSASTSTSSQVTTSSSTSTAPTGPTIVPSAGLYNYMGCYTEGTSGRAFSQLYANDSNTIAWCAQQCSAYTYFGAEYGRECWCGNSFGTGSTLTTASDCSMTCGGDKTAYCGAGNRLSVYIKNGTAGSVLSSFSVVLSSSSSSQISSSIASSSTSTQVPTTTSASSSSSSQPSTTSLSSSSSPTTTSPTTSAQTAPAIKPTIGAYAYKGCYTEATNMRALSVSSNVNYTSMTLENCAKFCSGSTMWGVEYGGECYCGSSLNPGSVVAPDTDCSFACPGSKLEYCGAGNRLSVYSLSPVGVGAISSSQSSSIPAQSSTSTSQSSSSNSVLPTSTSQGSSSPALSAATSQSATSTAQSTSTSSTSTSSSSPAQPTPTGPVVSQGNINFTYYSCVSEPSSGRLLSTQVENNGTYMTIEKCLSDCYNYAYAGVEYGRECWCGNTLNTAPGFKNTTDSDCSFTCPGNSTEFCGAGNRLNLYWFDAVKAKSNGALGS